MDMFIQLLTLAQDGGSLLESPWILGAGGFALVCIVGLGIYMKVYTRTESNVAFVRTGMGGLKVVLDGGALVFPVIHEITPISLATMELDIPIALAPTPIDKNSLLNLGALVCPETDKGRTNMIRKRWKKVRLILQRSPNKFEIKK